MAELASQATKALTDNDETNQGRGQERRRIPGGGAAWVVAVAVVVAAATQLVWASDSTESEASITDLVDLVSIEATGGVAQGTTAVSLVFDNQLQGQATEFLESVEAPAEGLVGVTTQWSGSFSESISVCGDTHSFPPPGNPTVDILVPTAWLSPDAAMEPNIVWARGDSGSKIIVCRPADGFLQVAIWGAASAQAEDVSVVVEGNRISVAIDPDGA